MADTINKPSIQIRSGLPSPLSDKSPSPATKLLISHGKPNFTIARSPKVEDNGHGPLSPQPNANNNYNPYKCASNNNNNNNNSSNKFVVGTKFNGVFKPSTAAANWAQSNGNGTAEENEAAKVVLRRPKLANVEPTPATGDDENVPEFILRQRRIQERLAKENVLDFENRRSGYFTHVMISPDSPNRTSFVETMASPAIVPALEMPLIAKIEEEQQQKEEVEQVASVANGHSEPQETPAELTNGHNGELHEEQEKALTNGHGHDDVAPEEVAQAIEEVNKAVAGEDDDSKSEVEQVEIKSEIEVLAHTAAAVEVAPASVEAHVEVVTHVENGVTPASNGHEEAITISHTNGHDTEQPSIATPDPSGALGVNYEPKTVVSFSQELGSGENNYPDTVQVTKEVASTPADAPLQELAKLKFDIQNDDKNEVQVTPVLRAE